MKVRIYLFKKVGISLSSFSINHTKLFNNDRCILIVEYKLYSEPRVTFECLNGENGLFYQCIMMFCDGIRLPGYTWGKKSKREVT